MPARPARVAFLLLVTTLATMQAVAGGRADETGRPRPRAEDGVLDLSDWNFADDGTVELGGEWLIAWREFTEPSEDPAVFNALAERTDRFEMPSTWDNYTVDGVRVGGLGYATFTLRVTLPDSLPRYGLLIPNASTAYELYVNGRLTAASGTPGRTAARSRPHYRIETAELDATSPESILTLHVSNFHHRRGGMWKPLTIGLPEQIDAIDAAELTYDVLLLGGFLALAAYNLFLFLTTKRRPAAPLLLALGLFAMALRMSMTGHMLATRAILAFPWGLQLRIEYMTAQFIFLVLGWLIELVYPKALPKWAIWSITGFIAVNMLATALLPVLAYSRVVGYYNYIKGAALLVISVRFAVMGIRGRREAWVMVSAIVLFLLITFGEVLHYGEFVLSREFAPFGFLIALLGGEEVRHTSLYFATTALTLGIFFIVFSLLAVRLSRSLSVVSGQTELHAVEVPEEVNLGVQFGLTPRELEILTLVARGRSNKEIGGDLSISEGTVKNHLYRIMRKTGFGNRTELAMLVRDAADRQRLAGGAD